jgi:hypothetical protein
MQITTQQFGGMWGQNPYERQFTVSLPGVNSTDDYKASLKQKLGFHVVEVIGNEVISAATSNNALENNATVLIHCWVNAGGPLKFTIKSTS